ncbi:unnamed protein product [Brachionus calyciflorus]|uniref:Uncharacterized protein n=1 Tax=Brachionus calyciflorus TaxID=104777 RepID=A0A813M8B5_9BILA|nr:unnamed protein product [Brachionus calyciflorus]
MLLFSISSILLKKSVNKNAVSFLKPKYLSHFSRYMRNNGKPENKNEDKTEWDEYTQGQYVEDLDVHEYFYFIDQHGQLFLDDTRHKTYASCYKEQKFLQYFYENLRMNKRDRYLKEFPYVSLCGSERNYLRCEDLPFVITKLDEKNDLLHLNQISTAHWAFHFDPKRLYHNPRNERLYYLFEDKELISAKQEFTCGHDDPKRLKHLDKLPCRIALVKPQIAIHLMKKFKVILDKDEKLVNEPLYKIDYKTHLFDLNNVNLCPKVVDLLDKFSMYGKCKHALINNRCVSQLSGQVNKPDGQDYYVQGQYVENEKTREYFYFIDHQGQLFLDDTKIKNFTSCYKEKKFLEFFFRKLRNNKTDRYNKKFPFISYCGLERNYLNCDDLPFVVTLLDEANGLIQLNQINSSNWSFRFDPKNLFHNQKNGRLYYLFQGQEIVKHNEMCGNDPRRMNHLDNLPCRVALVKSEISLRLMEKVQIDNGELKFEYKSQVYNLNNDENSKASEQVSEFSNLKE